MTVEQMGKNIIELFGENSLSYYNFEYSRINGMNENGLKKLYILTLESEEKDIILKTQSLLARGVKITVLLNDVKEGADNEIT